MRPLTPACLRVRSRNRAGLPSDSGRAGIWVTETTLSRVFERYVRRGAGLLDRCCTQPRPRRFSSTRTPVEEQRRAGRSQAARLNILSTGPAVRPRMPSLRPCSRPRPYDDQDSAAAAASAAACWRWAAPLGLPALRRRHEIVSTISDLSVIISDSTPALFRRGPPAPPGGSISETLARAGEAISEARGHADLEGIKLYIDFVGRQVRSGLASAREVRAALDVIARALEENCWLDEGDRAVLLGDLCSQIIHGMRAPAARKNLGHLELSDWCTLFDVVSRLGIDGLSLLASAMSCMLGEQSAPAAEAQIRALLAVMTGGAQDHEDSAAGLLVNAARDFSASVMVSGADPGTQTPKSSSSSSSIGRTQLCAAWVAITTCTPFIGVVELFGALGDVCPDIGRLDDELVCRLLMARWANQESHLDMSPCRDMFDQLRGAHANQHTPALLMLAICRLPDPDAHMLRCRELWLAMNSLGRGEHVIAAFSELAARHHGMLETYHLRLAAMTAHDHRFAIRLHSLVCEHAATLPDRGMEWGWEGWADYTESMCADEGLDPMKIWHLLGVLNRTDHRLSTDEYKGGMDRGWAGVPSRQQAAMVETVLQRIAGETRLDAQKALRVVVRGVEWLLFCKATITEETIEAARRVVERYLDEGGKGLGKSCGWLLRVMRRWQVDRGLTPWRPSQYRGCRLAPLPG